MQSEATDGTGGPEDTIAQLLQSLGNPVRLVLLHQLRVPRTLGEIRLPAQQARREGLAPGRIMSRQAVRHHLDILLEAGFVVARERVRGGNVVEEYVVNHRGLFALAEEVRAMANLRPRDLDAGPATMDLGDATPRRGDAGPRLLMVHGLNEGTPFPLVGGRGTGEREWIIGRRPDVAIVLDHDPFISSENTRIRRDADAEMWVEDLPGSRNGTSVNWVPVPKGERMALRNGDVIGLGRTLLLYRD